MTKLNKANFSVKTLRNIDPASSTFTFETQAVFHLAGDVTTVFVVPGKVTVKIGDGGIKIDKKKAKNIIQSVLSRVCFKSEIMSIKCQGMSFLLDASKVKRTRLCVLCYRMR